MKMVSAFKRAVDDRDGHAVVFSIVTNAGNRSRERMATMIQAGPAPLASRSTLSPSTFRL